MMKQIYLTLEYVSNKYLLILYFVCLQVGVYAQLPDSVESRKQILIDQSAFSDLVITAAQIRSINPVDLLRVIEFYDPSLVAADFRQLYGDSPNVQLSTFTVRGADKWAKNELGKPSKTAFVLDGALVDARKFFDVDINDIDKLIIRKDPVSLAFYGIIGGDGVLEIVTKTPVKGSLKVRYMFDAIVKTPDLSSYNQMNGLQKLSFEKRAGLYDSEEALYRQRSSDVERGVNTDWLNARLHTAFSHRHKINIEGGDDNVKYRLSARITPSGQGVMEASERDIVGVSAYIEYRYKSLKISNELSYDNIKHSSDPYFSLDYYARTNPYFDPLNEVGQPTKMLGDGTFNRQVNPYYEATLSSMNKQKMHSIYDNFRVSLDICDGLSVNGRFTLVRDMLQQDIYLSPNSGLYTDFPIGSYTGIYHIGRQNQQTYEGALDLSYNKQIGKSLFGASLQASIIDGKYNLEEYGGIGIPSDKMGFISFTKVYDSSNPPYALRTYDHTLRSNLSVYYAYDSRYSVTASLHADRSSLLSPDRKNALFYAASATWNIHNEMFLKGVDAVDRLSVRAAIGTSGSVEANSTDYLVSYSSNINNEYIHNYYLVGSAIDMMPNPAIRAMSLMSRTISLDAKFLNSIQLRFNYYNNRSFDLLSLTQLPLSTGYSSTNGNGGEVHNAGFDYHLSVGVLNRNDLRISVFTAGYHNENKIISIPAYHQKMYNEDTKKVVSSGQLGADGALYGFIAEGQDINTLYAYESRIEGSNEVIGDYVAVGSSSPDFQGNMGVNFGYGGWSATVACDFRVGGYLYNRTLHEAQYGNAAENLDARASDVRCFNNTSNRPLVRFAEKFNEFNLGTVQVGYTFPLQMIKKIWLSNLSIFATGNNLLTKSTVEMNRGVLYPSARTFSLSLRVAF